MAAYLRFYQFASSPFDGSVTKRGMVLGTPALRGALAQVKQALEEGAPRICLSGSEGLGKTSFGRALPKLLANEAQVAVSIDPNRSWDEIRTRACKKFGIQSSAMSRKSLVAARQSGKRLVIVFDQAERLGHEILDHLDILLQYTDDEGEQLVHCVMLANLEAAASGAEIPLLWWLDRFTTLQLQFSPIPVEGVKNYVEKHLAKAGWAGGELFTPEALRSIHSYTGGVPGAINELCERILIEGGRRSINSIDEQFIDELCGNDLGAPVPATEPLDRSADFSMNLFASGPTAQEMLDDPSAQAAFADEPAFDLRPEPPIATETEKDLSSLLVTEDSPEPLRTAAEAPAANRESNAPLELEDEPDAHKFADSYEQRGGTSAQLVGLSRPGAGMTPIQRPKRRNGGWIIAALVVAGIGWFAHSRLSVPTEFIESAEKKIEKVLEQAPKLSIAKPTAREELEASAFDEAAEPIDSELTQGDATESTAIAHRSLIDRADEIIADLDANPSPTPEAVMDSSEARDEIGAEKPSPHTTKAVATSEPKPATLDIPSEMLVVNEYTAIPEAASAAPQLAMPSTEDEQGHLEAAVAADETVPPARVDPTGGAPTQGGEASAVAKP